MMARNIDLITRISLANVHPDSQQSSTRALAFRPATAADASPAFVSPPPMQPSSQDTKQHSKHLPPQDVRQDPRQYSQRDTQQDTRQDPDEHTIEVVAFTDTAFANNKDLSSQLGYVIALRDASGKCNVVHWSSSKCRRVTKSVLAAELYALVLGFDVASCIKATVDKIYGKQIPLVICTDSRSVFDALTRLGTTAGKLLMIDVAMLRQSYERREIAEVK